MRNRFTKADDEIIMKLRNQGFSWAEIDSQLGLPKTSARGRIWRLARRQQDPEAMRLSTPYKGLTSSQKCLILKLRARKLSLGAIASKLQKPFEAIRTVVNDLPNFRTPRKKWSDAEEQALKRYREEFGLTWREIGQLLGRSAAGCAVRYCSKRQQDPRTTLVPKSRFLEEEDEDLLKLKREFRLQWSEVHAYMPHRSLSSLQMRYYHHLQKRP
ncbi:Myb-like DNA-binding BAS1 [Lecanosticta acicola]|uniref:Myb-like DNA-binding BAS1 n=1 Tax=Lecanosticta acicola TaxID=111012 RepID=A0AAI8W1I3_9PEZI|nr:Myb-like DNA-binding BAS1 [Lecanosticta acicola]